MPVSFSSIEENRVGQVSQWDMPVSSWLGYKFNTGLSSRLGPRLFNLLDGVDESAMLSPEEANRQFGIPGHLKFDAPTRIERAHYMRQQKDTELEQAAYAASASHSALSFKAFAGFGAMVAGSLAHPLDIAVNFIPFVGTEEAAAKVAATGGSLLERTLARGVVTGESLARNFPRFPNYSRALVDATFGNAVAEIPNFALNVRDQAAYGPEDALANIFVGGFAGGTIGHGVHTLFKHALTGYLKLSVESKEAAYRTALGDAMRDGEGSIVQHANVDENLIRERAAFDQVKAREEALKELGALPEEAQLRAIVEMLNKGEASATDLLDMARAGASEGSARGKALSGAIERFRAGDATPEIFKELAAIFDVRYNPLAPTVQEALKQHNFFGNWQETSRGVQAALGLRQDQLIRYDKRIAEVLGLLKAHRDAGGGPGGAELHADLVALYADRKAVNEHVDALKAEAGRGPLTPEEISAHAHALRDSGYTPDEIDVIGGQLARESLESRIQEIRDRRIGELVEKKRQEWEAAAADRLSGLRLEGLKAQQARGKILTDEQVKEFTLKRDDPAAKEILAQDVANLEAQLKQKATPGASEADLKFNEAIQEVIDKGLAAKQAPDISKAIEAAAECIGRTIV